MLLKLPRLRLWRAMEAKTSKVCKKCGAEKPLTEFYKDPSYRDGLYAVCKACKIEAAASWLAQHPEKSRAAVARYYVKNRESILEKQNETRHLETYGVKKQPILDMHKDRFRHARALGYRSGLEVRITTELANQNVPFDYELYTLPYIVPVTPRKYTCDILLRNGILVELKGEFDSADRKKMLLVREQHPDIDIRIMFGNANAKIGKKSKTTYALWCKRNGFKCAHEHIPHEWIQEPLNQVSMDAILAANVKPPAPAPPVADAAA